MVDAETGKMPFLVGLIMAIIAAVSYIPAVYLNIFPISVGIIGMILGYGGGLLAFYGFITYFFIGEKYIQCLACGAKIKENVYYCPNCNVKSPKFYKKKLICNFCGKRTRYYDYGGRCKYCGNLLPRV